MVDSNWLDEEYLDFFINSIDLCPENLQTKLDLDLFKLEKLHYETRGAKYRYQSSHLVKCHELLKVGRFQ